VVLFAGCWLVDCWLLAAGCWVLLLLGGGPLCRLPPPSRSVSVLHKLPLIRPLCLANVSGPRNN
jgi:hypothetical protein